MVFLLKLSLRHRKMCLKQINREVKAESDKYLAVYQLVLYGISPTYKWFTVDICHVKNSSFHISRIVVEKFRSNLFQRFLLNLTCHVSDYFELEGHKHVLFVRSRNVYRPRKPP